MACRLLQGLWLPAVSRRSILGLSPHQGDRAQLAEDAAGLLGELEQAVADAGDLQDLLQRAEAQRAVDVVRCWPPSACHRL